MMPAPEASPVKAPMVPAAIESTVVRPTTKPAVVRTAGTTVMRAMVLML
jgi:hypothetical protein